MAVRKFLALIRNWLKIEIRVFHYDNERSAGNEVESMIEDEGCTIEHTPPGLPEMNGPAERSGGMIVRNGRALLNDTNLPHNLWPETMYASAYMMNRTPTKVGDKWIIPWKELMLHAAPDGLKDQVINLSNIRLYGCLTYSRLLKRVQSDKMAPRAEIGYLVGYVSKSLYKIWFPHKGRTGIGRVEIVRDAVFDESRQYSKTKPLPQSEDAISTMTNGLSTEYWPQVLSMEEAQSELSIEMRMPMSIARIALNDDIEHGEQGVAPEAINEEIQESGDIEQFAALENDREETPRVPPLKETPDLPLTPASIAGTIQRDQDHVPGSFPMSPQRALPQRASPPTAMTKDTPREGSPILSSSPDPINVIQSIETEGGEGDQYDEDEAEIERQLQQEMQYTPTPEPENRPTREISATIDESNIISGPRTRRPKADPDYATYLSLDEKLAEPPSLLYAFTTSIMKKYNMQNRLHRDQMPPPPENWVQLKIHPFAKQLMAAAEFEIETLKAKETFSQVALPNKKNI